VLGAYIGLWVGEYQGRVAAWVRLYREDGSLVPTLGELAALERARAEAERQRAERAEAELEQLRTLLRERGIEI
jgi:transposase-like protein